MESLITVEREGTPITITMRLSHKQATSFRRFLEAYFPKAVSVSSEFQAGDLVTAELVTKLLNVC